MRSYFLLFLVFLSACQEYKESDNQISQSNIINGLNTDSNLQKEIALSTVGITISETELPYCSGVLISQDVVLTAAHCVVTSDFRPLKTYYVLFGPKLTASNKNAIQIDGFIFHPEYNPKTSKADLALIFLKKPAAKKYIPAKISTGETYPNILYPSGVSPFNKTSVSDIYEQLTEKDYSTIEGNSYSEKNEKFRFTLFKPALLVANLISQKTDKIYFFNNTGSLQHGDSGGGLFIKRENNFLLTGIHSQGVNPFKLPSLELGTSTIISRYQNWIQVKLLENKSLPAQFIKIDQNAITSINQESASCFKVANQMSGLLLNTSQLRASDQYQYCEKRSQILEQLEFLTTSCFEVCPNTGEMKGFCDFYKNGLRKFPENCLDEFK
ncbi:MAG: trypsin-like serine protease [Bacteriovoracaceae bacterium]